MTDNHLTNDLTVIVPVINSDRPAVIDASDAKIVLAHNWFLHGNGYPIYRIWPNEQMAMHQLIVSKNIGGQIDHINGDKLDNRRANLRYCTHAQNQMNNKKRSGTSSKFKGVSLNKASGKWKAYIKYQQRYISLGTYASEVEAAESYNRAAIHYFGEFARLNILGYGKAV